MNEELTAWRFLPNEAMENEGLGDPGIETYRDTPYLSAARECGQNSHDAIEKTPVRLSFELLDVPRTEIPSFEDLRRTFQLCEKKAQAAGDEKEIEFFENAVQVLNSKSIPVLKISDENTTGLIGPCIDGKPFHSLVKSTGVSSKSSPTSGGSFGIGKNAVFAVSELQTVFYSTLYSDGSDQDRFLAMGKSVLVSHVDNEEISYRARGYWSLAGYSPVSDQSLVPNWLKRSCRGTSVCAIGFPKVEGWEYRIAASLIQNFFIAISRGLMEFAIVLPEQEIVITAETLDSLFENTKIREGAARENRSEDFEFAHSLHLATTAVEASEHHLESSELGEVKLTILVDEGLQKRICIVRNGMVLTDSLENFGDKFKSFPQYKEFVALVEPLDGKGQALLKRLENPRHDGLSAERIHDKAKQRSAQQAMKRLANQIRELVKSKAKSLPNNEEALDELSEFFSYGQEHADDKKKGDYDPEQIIVEVKTKKRVEVKTKLSPKTGGSGGGRGLKGSHTGGGKKKSKGKGSGIGKGGHEHNPTIGIAAFRNKMLKTGEGLSRKVMFSPEESGLAKLTVLATGLNYPQVLPVIASDQGEVSGGSIELDVQAGVRYGLSLTFAQSYDGPIEIAAEKLVSGGPA